VTALADGGFNESGSVVDIYVLVIVDDVKVFKNIV